MQLDAVADNCEEFFLMDGRDPVELPALSSCV